MKPYPHLHTVNAAAAPAASVELTAERLPKIHSAPPIEFDGPGGQWSPESLLVASVVDCFVLTFRAIARAFKLEWSALHWRVEGTLDPRFVAVRFHTDLRLPGGGNTETSLLEKAEKTCLIANSLALPVELDAKVVADG